MSMLRRLVYGATAAIVGLGVLMVALTTASADDEKTPTNKEVMKKINGKGATTEGAKLKTALTKKPTDWTAVQTTTREIATLTAALAKNEPKKGDAASWKKFADAYAAQGKALDEAAEKKDLAATQSAFQQMGRSCMGCHRAHRG